MKKFTQEAVDAFVGSFTAPKTKGTWIILVNGEQVMMENKKCVWKTRGAAKNALHNHLGYGLWDNPAAATPQNKYWSSNLSWKGALFYMMNGHAYSYKNVGASKELKDMYEGFLIEMEAEGILEYKEVK